MCSGQGKGDRSTVHFSVEGKQLSETDGGGDPKGLQGEGSVVVGITRSYTAAWLGRASGGIQGREMQNMLWILDKPSRHKTDSCSADSSIIHVMMLE